MKPLTHASLFTGIGGADLAGEAAGFETKFQCELDPFVNPSSDSDSLMQNSTETSGKSGGGDIIKACRGNPTVLSGGFPCQPVSLAGKRQGNEDVRWLWPEYIRLIRECRPHWIVAENVANLPNIPEFGGIHADLEDEGYEIGILEISAASAGAPHIRKRCFVVAHSLRIGQEEDEDITRGIQSAQSKPADIRGNDPCGDTQVTNSDVISGFQTDQTVDSPGVGRKTRDDVMCCSFDQGLSLPTNSIKIKNGTYKGTASKGERYRIPLREDVARRSGGRITLPDWSSYPPAVCRMDDGFPRGVDKSRLQALGNAIVPRQIYPIFDAIARIERGGC